MQIPRHQTKRKAISPVLATVILIAITLIAAIAIAGFVFGLFGTFTSSARVSASVTSCTGGGTLVISCNLVLSNTGTSNATPTACSATAGGETHTGTMTTTQVVAGTQQAETCSAITFVAPLTTISVGSQITGSVSLNNGAAVPFTGTVST